MPWIVGGAVRSFMARYGAFGAAALALTLAACSSKPPETPTPPDPAKALARSISIIRSATPEHPRVLKLLFYGQSISTRKWTDQAVAALRARYPNVVFDVRNMAIGGWHAAMLERAVNRDVDEAQPDLIVFHVFGDKDAYERIIRAFRSRTSADVIVQTDYVVTPVEPLCPAGIQLRWSPPPGCQGHIRFKQRFWQDYMSGFWIPTMAQKYSLAVEPRRVRWNAYLKANHLDPMALLAPSLHPNERGWSLMADLFTSWFEGVVDKGATQAPPHDDAVRSFAPPRPGATATYEFTGSRIELLAAGPLDGKVQVTIDGKASQDLDGCWQDSRVSRLPNAPEWPGLRQVSVSPAYHRADSWTLRLTGFNAAQDQFAFTLSSASGGADGKGMAAEPFTSTSGRVKIEPDDWMIHTALESGKRVPEGLELHWQRRFVCADEPAVALPNGGMEQRHVLATGLPNGRHAVRLILAPGAPAVAELRAYRPPIMGDR
jgi:hypothetical protein